MKTVDLLRGVDDQRSHERVDLVTIRMFIDTGRSRKPKRSRINSDALENKNRLAGRSQSRSTDGICRTRVRDELGATWRVLGGGFLHLARAKCRNGQASRASSVADQKSLHRQTGSPRV